MSIEILKKELNKEHAAFSGWTHILIAVCLFLLMWLLPWPFATNYINAIKGNIVFGFLIFFIIAGASLLPDLDSSKLQGGGSSAIYELGFLGDLLSLLFITISGVVYSIAHTRYDDKPKSQHRMLFHAPIIPILIYIYVQTLPDGYSKLINNISFENSGILILVFFIGISVYLGSLVFLYRSLKLMGKQRYAQIFSIIIMVLSTIYMLNVEYSKLKLLGVALSLGYLFHIIGDILTKGSSPLFFPIPIPNKKGHLRLWWKPYLFGSQFAITTGGVLNIILNFILLGVNIFLAWFIFIK